MAIKSETFSLEDESTAGKWLERHNYVGDRILDYDYLTIQSTFSVHERTSTWQLTIQGPGKDVLELARRAEKAIDFTGGTELTEETP